MRFAPSLINQYYKQWESFSPTVISQSNPQPFTLAELEVIIGSTENIFDPQKELGYTTTCGDELLRTAIAALYDHKDSNHIATFTGAQEAIYCSMHALLEPGDKVVAITPIFEPLINTARDLNCDIQFILLQVEDEWRLDINKIEDAIKSGCKLLALNYPHNPTGSMISKEQLFQIIKICDNNNCWILSDEVFRGLEHDPVDRLPAIVDAYPKALSISVMSKAFALPAIRIGWISCQDKAILERALEVKDYLSICNSLLDEQLVLQVLPHYETIWQRNRKLILGHLKQLVNFMEQRQAKFKLIKPQAGCTAFPILHGEQTATEYCDQLIRSKNLMVLPDELFLSTVNGFRLGFGYAHQTDHYQFLV